MVVQVSARDLPTATGTLAGVVRFVSVDDAAKVIDVPVRVAVAGSLSAEPNRLFLGTRRRSEQFTETIVVTSSPAER